MRWWACVALVCALCLPADAANRRRTRHYRSFKATAYSTRGITASGVHTRVGTVAADPRVLPLGTRIRVKNAGRHSGVYVVTDTGALVKGRHIDLYVPRTTDAREFGQKVVLVSVLEWGTPGS